jgi:hypothetical protein
MISFDASVMPLRLVARAIVHPGALKPPLTN